MRGEKKIYKSSAVYLVNKNVFIGVCFGINRGHKRSCVQKNKSLFAARQRRILMPFDYRNSQTGTGEPNLTRWTSGCSRFTPQYENAAEHNRRTCRSIAHAVGLKREAYLLKSSVDRSCGVSAVCYTQDTPTLCFHFNLIRSKTYFYVKCRKIFEGITI